MSSHFNVIDEFWEMIAKSKRQSSKRWLERQHADPYVLKAKQEGFRSRAAYKLLEIQERDKMIKKGATVIDLGAAPGGWSQVVRSIVGQNGFVLAIDILPMEPLKGVDIIIGDFREQEVVRQLIDKLQDRKVDLVISDMAPNLSGISSSDQARSIELAEMALAFAQAILPKGGVLLVKVFQGSGFQAYVLSLKQSFSQVLVRKPKASRSESREVYLLAKNFMQSSIMSERQQS
jgi:23S rRNA (uridine2552-2'-O)-methyltransferase